MVHTFSNGMTNFDLNLLSINKISFEKNTDCVIYEIEYFKNLYSKNSLYLIFDNVDEYIEYNPTEDDSETKYLVFPFTNKNREALENYTQLWDESKDQIETINGDNPIEYGKDFMKARFESNDDLPLHKILIIPVCIIFVKKKFFKKITTIIHKFHYMNVYMSMRIDFSNQMLLLTSCVKLHFCSEIFLIFFQMKCQYSYIH